MTPPKKYILQSQWQSATTHRMLCCGQCGRVRALELAFRCLYCGIWFCFSCAESHFGLKVRDYRASQLDPDYQI